MKIIYLIRHAESLIEMKLKDFDRSISAKGNDDAKTLSKQLICKPDLIIASAAKRTKQTSLIFAKALNYAIDKIDFELEIYEAPIEKLIKKVNIIDSKHNTVLLIGHNPGITLLANYLTADFISPVAPCTIIKIVLEIENWNEIITGIGKTETLITP